MTEGTENRRTNGTDRMRRLAALDSDDPTGKPGGNLGQIRGQATLSLYSTRIRNLGTGYASTLFKKASTPFSGEQIVYTYDALNRLASAQTTSGPTPWGQSYNYDGFGNLVDQNVILGSAPSMSATYNPATNRQYSDSADANGNVLTDSNGDGLAYDGVNRLIGAVAYVYGYRDTFAYDAQNHRVMRTDSSGNQYYAFWGPNGQKLCEYTLGQNGSTYYFAMAHEWVYFGGKLIAKDNTFVVADRLGSMNGKYYPYGQERPSATANDTEKFTGYFRDSATGLDYAVNRYHQPGIGRFMTADPYQASASPSDPGSWNRYDYVGDDPANGTDPSGLCPIGQSTGACVATGIAGGMKIVGGVLGVVGGAAAIGGSGGLGTPVGIALVGGGLSGVVSGFNNVYQSVRRGGGPGVNSILGPISTLYDPVSAGSALISGNLNLLSSQQRAFVGASGSAFRFGLRNNPLLPSNGGGLSNVAGWAGVLGNMILASIPETDPTTSVTSTISYNGVTSTSDTCSNLDDPGCAADFVAAQGLDTCDWTCAEEADGDTVDFFE